MGKTKKGCQGCIHASAVAIPAVRLVAFCTQPKGPFTMSSRGTLGGGGWDLSTVIDNETPVRSFVLPTIGAELKVDPHGRIHILENMQKQLGGGSGQDEGSWAPRPSTTGTRRVRVGAKGATMSGAQRRPFQVPSGNDSASISASGGASGSARGGGGSRGSDAWGGASGSGGSRGTPGDNSRGRGWGAGGDAGTGAGQKSGGGRRAAAGGGESGSRSAPHAASPYCQQRRAAPRTAPRGFSGETKRTKSHAAGRGSSKGSKGGRNAQRGNSNRPSTVGSRTGSSRGGGTPGGRSDGGEEGGGSRESRRRKRPPMQYADLMREQKERALRPAASAPAIVGGRGLGGMDGMDGLGGDMGGLGGLGGLVGGPNEAGGGWRDGDGEFAAESAALYGEDRGAVRAMFDGEAGEDDLFDQVSKHLSCAEGAEQRGSEGGGGGGQHDGVHGEKGLGREAPRATTPSRVGFADELNDVSRIHQQPPSPRRPEEPAPPPPPMAPPPLPPPVEGRNGQHRSSDPSWNGLTPAGTDAELKLGGAFREARERHPSGGRGLSSDSGGSGSEWDPAGEDDDNYGGGNGGGNGGGGQYLAHYEHIQNTHRVGNRGGEERGEEGGEEGAADDGSIRRYGTEFPEETRRYIEEAGMWGEGARSPPRTPSSRGSMPGSRGGAAGMSLRGGSREGSLMGGSREGGGRRQHSSSRGSSRGGSSSRRRRREAQQAAEDEAAAAAGFTKATGMISGMIEGSLEGIGGGSQYVDTRPVSPHKGIFGPETGKGEREVHNLTGGVTPWRGTGNPTGTLARERETERERKKRERIEKVRKSEGMGQI